jgi:Rrf2 family protein
MQVSTRSDYCIRVVLELALAAPQAVLTAEDLAARAGVPSKYLLRLLRDLQAGGIVRGTRGWHGGYSLMRDPGDVTVAEVVRLMDGPLAPVACASVMAHVPCPQSRCQTEESCVLRDMWMSVRNAIAEVLENTTFADLANRRRAGSTQIAHGYSI